MFSGISWSSYFRLILFLLVIYYVFVWFRFFRTRKESTDEDPESYELLKKAAEKIRYTIMVARKENYDETQLRASLSDELQQYAPLRQTRYATALKNLVITESKSIGSIPFSEEDVDLMWKG